MDWALHPGPRGADQCHVTINHCPSLISGRTLISSQFVDYALEQKQNVEGIVFTGTGI